MVTIVCPLGQHHQGPHAPHYTQQLLQSHQLPPSTHEPLAAAMHQPDHPQYPQQWQEPLTLTEGYDDVIGLPHAIPSYCASDKLAATLYLDLQLQHASPTPHTPPDITACLPQQPPQDYRQAPPTLSGQEDEPLITQVSQGSTPGMQDFHLEDIPNLLLDYKGLQVPLEDIPNLLLDCNGLPDLQQEEQSVTKVLPQSQGAPQVDLGGTPQIPECPAQPHTLPHLLPDSAEDTPTSSWLSQHLSPGYQQAAPTHQEYPGLQDAMKDLEELQDSSGASPIGLGTPQSTPQSPQTASAVCVASQGGSSVDKAGAEQRKAVAPKRSRRNSKCQHKWLYQKEKFANPLQEKRRRDAINSKKNREAKKAFMRELRRRVQDATTVRDTLLQEVATLRRREELLMARVRALVPA